MKHGLCILNICYSFHFLFIQSWLFFSFSFFFLFLWEWNSLNAVLCSKLGSFFWKSFHYFAVCRQCEMTAISCPKSVTSSDSHSHTHALSSREQDSLSWLCRRKCNCYGTCVLRETCSKHCIFTRSCKTVTMNCFLKHTYLKCCSFWISEWACMVSIWNNSEPFIGCLLIVPDKTD